MAEDKKLRVGFIGVGTMGRGMVKNLLKAGFPVTIYARHPSTVQEAVEAGAQLVASSRAVAEISDLVITMVPDSPEVEEVILGAEGVLGGAQVGTVVVDMSTINPATSRKVANQCAEKGVAFLDAPVSGGSWGAENGTLVIMVGGEAAVVERCRPVFEAMGRADGILHVGSVGSGEVVKLVNNMVSAIITAATGEAFAMGIKAGVDPATIYEVVSKSSGASWQLLNAFTRNIFTGAFQPGFFTDLMYKDVGIGLALGAETGVPLTLAEQAYRLYATAIAAGYGHDDYTSVVRPIEEAAGVEIRIAPQE
ncbi:MAG: NAD(P)-dependent oxidoreductase [Chloroflexi bacterium]|nr:NAD(P)-dependent oxidoreductase [Chloroflexota bacterium]